MLWIVLVIAVLFFVCFWLFKILNVRNMDESIYDDRKKFFPAQLKPPSKMPPINPPKAEKKESGPSPDVDKKDSGPGPKPA